MLRNKSNWDGNHTWRENTTATKYTAHAPHHSLAIHKTLLFPRVTLSCTAVHTAHTAWQKAGRTWRLVCTWLTSWDGVPARESDVQSKGVPLILSVLLRCWWMVDSMMLINDCALVQTSLMVLVQWSQLHSDWSCAFLWPRMRGCWARSTQIACLHAENFCWLNFAAFPPASKPIHWIFLDFRTGAFYWLSVFFFKVESTLPIFGKLVIGKKHRHFLNFIVIRWNKKKHTTIFHISFRKVLISPVLICAAAAALQSADECTSLPSQSVRDNIFFGLPNDITGPLMHPLGPVKDTWALYHHFGWTADQSLPPPIFWDWLL